MNGQLSFMPSSLPPGLYDQAAGKTSLTVGNLGTPPTGGGNSPYNSPSSNFRPPPIPARSPVQSLVTGQSSLSGILNTGPRLPARPSAASNSAGNLSSIVASPLRSPQQSLAWDVSTTEKAKSDHFFDQLDPEMKGYIPGEVAGPWLLQSQLDGETLEKVWFVFSFSCVDLPSGCFPTGTLPI